MLVSTVLLPVFVQVALTFALLIWMERSRVGAIERGEVKINDIALGQSAWPERQTKIANCFHNQLQLPVLFYVLVILALFTKQADYLFVILSWIFVLSRLVHAYIHVTANSVSQRFYAFAFGAMVLLLMWAIFAFHIIVAA